MADPILIIGHKNPDNDAISAAIGFAFFKRVLERREGGTEEYKAVRLGPLPPETAWNLALNNIEPPELIDHVEPGQRVVIVDHNELPQAADGMEYAEVLEVVDHHRIGGITTPGPIFMTLRPWGSTATIVTWLCRRHEVGIPTGIANILLGAILTDTVMLKSPTTTSADLEQIAYLESIGGRPYREFGMQLFKCRGNDAEIPIEEFVGADAKEYEVGGKTVLIAQHETFDLAEAMRRERESRDYMRRLVSDRGYDYVLLLVTDIMQEGSSFVVEGNREQVDRVFGIDATSAVFLEGVMSRKKQVAAPILASV
ncbi:manganese-dependent inorganic pyrophosphatase [Curtanaerobium respiraculi]|uniref:manganese-dependent inorganic pyrophosphatase n=1 Tax=Curtanaerobium respiraculi TaxID=2949669 RepID=UPI0024B39139|nr:manganese-dependent inorganic pyrophosphatase [Curtanaerobium respiraculi]